MRAHRQRRRKSEKPSRAPEAAGPDWYADQNSGKHVGASSMMRPLSSGAMQLRRPRRKQDGLPPLDTDLAAAAAAPAALGTKFSTTRVGISTKPLTTFMRL